MSNNGVGRRDRSPPNDISSSSASKRRRIAFSCLDCRRRKLKCDRLFPSCSRCQKGGNPEACSYDIEAVNSGNQTHGTREPSIGQVTRVEGTIPPSSYVSRSFAADEGDAYNARLQPPNDTSSRLCIQEERIRELESRIISLEKAAYGGLLHCTGLAGNSELTHVNLKSASEQRDAAMRETIFFRGKSFKTQFYGTSHETSQLSHLPELRLFMKDMLLQYPRLNSIRRELKSTKVKGTQDDGILPSDSSLIKILPRRQIVDQLIQIYIDNLESIHRILHLPCFWKEYSAFWSAVQEPRPAFVALLLLMMASVTCLRERDSSTFRGDSSVERETAVMWIRNCDSWLQCQSQKHVTLTIFQLHCLSFIAKRMNSVKRKRTWTSAGTLMRLAISAGLHRDATVLNSRHEIPASKMVSLFDQEMRRRIWATISELELQTAFERGMPAMMRDIFEDCGSPLNLDDEDFDSTSEQLPSSKPPSEFTKSSYQHISRSSWSLRVELVSLFNRSSSQLSYDNVSTYDKQIMQHLAMIPHWKNQEGSLPRIVLQLQLHQLLVLLHQPFARDESWGPKHEYSALVHLRSAMTILDLHEKLIANGNNFLCLFRNDVLGAALSICHGVSCSDPRAENYLASQSSIIQLCGNPVSNLERALSILENRILCLGIGLQEHHLVCAIAGFVRKSLLPGSTGSEEQIAADRAAQMIERILALQDNYSAAATLASLPNVPTVPSKELNGVSDGKENPAPAAGDDHDMLTVEDILARWLPYLKLTNAVKDFGLNLEEFDLNGIGWGLDTFWDF